MNTSKSFIKSWSVWTYLLLDELDLLDLLEELLELLDEHDDEDVEESDEELLSRRIFLCRASNSSLDRFLKLYNAWNLSRSIFKFCLKNVLCNRDVVKCFVPYLSQQVFNLMSLTYSDHHHRNDKNWYKYCKFNEQKQWFHFICT